MTANLTELRDASPLIAAALHYCEQRPLNITRTGNPTGSKVVEEAGELRDALAENDLDHIREEIADVLISVSMLAAKLGLVPEECIAFKTIRDAGRGMQPSRTAASR